MVYFKDVISSDRKHLHIAEDENARDESVIKLLSVPSIVNIRAGLQIKLVSSHDHPNQWSEKISDNSISSNAWQLKSPPHLHPAASTPSSSLGRKIIAGTSHWGSLFRLRGEFCYITGYWEWLEDVVSRNKEILTEARIFDAICCSRYTYDRDIFIMRAFCEAWNPEFNTLETSRGAFSISLWDLHQLGGLAIHGDLYEEIVPSSNELLGLCSRGRNLPRSCKHLFAAFLRLHEVKDGKKIVRVSSWINFWFRGDIKYYKPARRSTKRVRPTEDTCNPVGLILEACPWSAVEQGAFEDLDIEDEARLSTYLSAFVACWLCIFVFPQNDAYIRPEIFKTASLMAAGRCFSLAVPVLAMLYRGLNEISRSKITANPRVCFPAHYIYGWLAFYFRTHRPVPREVIGPLMSGYSGEGRARLYDDRLARQHIHGGDNICWRANFLSKKGDFWIKDGPNMKDPAQSFFLSIRSCYLTLRRGDYFIAEPYYPPYFGRQFGFCQDIPCVLPNDTRSFSLEEGLMLWNFSTQLKTGSQLYVPAAPIELWNYSTERYRKWWGRKHGDYLKQGIEALITGSHPSQRKGDHTRENNIQRKVIRVSLPKKPASPVLPSEGSSTATDEDKHFKRRRRNEAFYADRTLIDPPPHSTHVLPILEEHLHPHADLVPEPIEETSDHSVLSPLGANLLMTSQTGLQSHQKDALKKVTPTKTVHVQKKDIATPAISSFCLDNVASRAYKKCAVSIWEDLKEKIARTPPDKGCTIVEEVKKIIAFVDGLGHINSTPIRALVEDFIKAVENHSDLEAIIMATTTPDEEISSTTTQLLRAEECVKDAVGRKTIIEEQLLKTRSQMSELVKVESTLEASLKDSANEIDELSAEVVNLKEIMSALKETRVVGGADLQSLGECRLLMEKTREDILQFQWAP